MGVQVEVSFDGRDHDLGCWFLGHPDKVGVVRRGQELLEAQRQSLEGCVKSDLHHQLLVERQRHATTQRCLEELAVTHQEERRVLENRYSQELSNVNSENDLRHERAIRQLHMRLKEREQTLSEECALLSSQLREERQAAMQHSEAWRAKYQDENAVVVANWERKLEEETQRIDVRWRDEMHQLKDLYAAQMTYLHEERTRQEQLHAGERAKLELQLERLREEAEKERMLSDARLKELGSQIAALTGSSYAKGLAGERSLENLIYQAYGTAPNFSLDNVRSTPDQSDRLLRILRLTVMIECKNHTGEVKSSEVTKFENQLRDNSAAHAGIIISATTSIHRYPGITAKLLDKNKLFVAIPGLMRYEDPVALLRALYPAFQVASAAVVQPTDSGLDFYFPNHEELLAIVQNIVQSGEQAVQRTLQRKRRAEQDWIAQLNDQRMLAHEGSRALQLLRGDSLSDTSSMPASDSLEVATAFDDEIQAFLASWFAADSACERFPISQVNDAFAAWKARHNIVSKTSTRFTGRLLARIPHIQRVGANPIVYQVDRNAILAHLALLGHLASPPPQNPSQIPTS